MKKWKLYSLVFLAYIGMALLQTWPLVLHLRDLTALYFNSVPAIYCGAEHALLFFVEHPFDLIKAFSPKISVPMDSPFFLLGTSMGAAIAFAPLYLFTQDLFFSGNIMHLIYLAGSAFSFFLLARYLLQSTRAAFVAGTVFSFCAANTFLTFDCFCLNQLVFPLVILYFFRFVYENRPGYLYICMALLACQFYVYFYHCLYAVYFMLAIAIWKRKLVFKKKNILPFLGAGLMGIVLIAPLAVPYLEKMFSYRFDQMAGSAESLFSYTFSFSPSEWFNVAPNNLLYGSWLAQTYATHGFPDFPHATLFPGILVWYMILVWAVKMPRDRISPWFLFGVMIFAVLATTGFSPLQFFRKEMSTAVVLLALSKFLPLISIVRNPNRLILFFNLALALLAGGAFVGLEKRLSDKKASRYAGLFCVLVVCVINVENLSLPTPLYNYDYITGPAASDEWLAQNNPLTSQDHTILHTPCPERVYQYDSGIPPVRLYVESCTGLFRHLINRHPVANSYISVPDGFISPQSMRLPEKIAQQHLYAIGVRLVVVHGSLMYGDYKEKFDIENMKAQGFELLVSFDDGDAIYRLEPEICMEKKLFLLPYIKGDILRIEAVTPGFYESMRSGEHRLESCFWVNPKVCKNQYVRATIADGKGTVHRRKISCYLPLVVQGRKQLLEYDLAKDGIKGPYRIKALCWDEPYLLLPLEMVLPGQ